MTSAAHILSPGRAGPHTSIDLERLSKLDGARAKHRLRTTIIKFGPLSLIIVLLFAVKYLLLDIHFNLHLLQSNLGQCEARAKATDFGEDFKNELWVQHKMMGRGTYGFVQWSSYRTSASRITAIGFGSVLLRDHREASSCIWHGADGKSITGEAKLHYPERKSDAHQYEVVLISCTLRGRVSTHLGGHAVVTLDREQVVAYREAPDSRQQDTSAEQPHAHRATFCTFPVVDPVDGERLREWVEIHRFIGAEHVVAYDAGGFDKLALGHLQPFVQEGFLEVTPMRQIVQYDIAEHGKTLAMHDCLYRSALSSGWVVYLDWDDVLMLRTPRFLPILLEDHRDAPWMSYGCRVFSTKLCARSAAHEGNALAHTASGLVPFPQERMLYHWPHYLCGEGEGSVDNHLCPGERGMRYLIVNPSKVTLLRSSEVVEPAEEGGLVLSAEDVRHDRFEGLHKEGASDKWCGEIHNAGDSVEWWQASTEVQELLQSVRKAKVEARKGQR